MKNTILILLFGLNVLAELPMLQPTFMSCRHVDQSVPMGALKNFEVFISAEQAHDIIVSSKTDLAFGTVATEWNNQRVAVPISFQKKESGKVDFQIDFGDGMSTYHLKGQVDPEKDVNEKLFAYAHFTEESRFQKNYLFSCQMGLR